MVDVLYAVMALVSLVVIFIMLNYMRRSDIEQKLFKSVKKLLIVFAGFCGIDAIWGFVASHTLFIGNSGLYVVSVMFHLAALTLSFYWCTYTYKYLNKLKGLPQKLLLHIPLFAGLFFVILNFFNDCIFYIDEEWIYHSGFARYAIFIIEYMYYLISGVICVLSILCETDKRKRYGEYTMLMFSTIPIIFGMLQFEYPNAPFYSCGCMIAVIVLLCGSLSEEKEKKLKEDNEFLRAESQEVYRVLERITKSFVSVHLFDLERNKQHSVKSTRYVDAFIFPEDGADEQIRKVMGGVTDSEYTKGMQEFVDTHTLNDRMKGKNIISREFLGKNQGWCISSFLRFDSAPDEEIKKVIHVVQSIDDVKKREIEYEKALREAYEDQNFIYTEMLKMQASGVIATDTEDHIITMNDAAARLFNYESAEKAPKNYSEILDRIEIDNAEEAVIRYRDLKNKGVNLEYYFSTVTADGKNVYVLANAKRISLTNGTKAIVTTYTDITKNREMEDELLKMSETDALTGIRNRGSGEAKISYLLENGSDGLFCLLDINKFKSFNDNFGHNVGDKVLISIANSLRDSFREKDVVMRLGGDEYAVFAPGIQSRQGAEHCIKRFFGAVDGIVIEELGDYKINVSLGAVFSSSVEDKTFDTVYKAADAVMYDCKDKQGNNFAFYN